MRGIIRFTALTAALIMLCSTACAAPEKFLGCLQEVHKVDSSYSDVTNANGSVVRTWSVKTAREDVDLELSDLVQDYVDDMGQDLPKAANKADGNSRLDVEIRYQRTGTSWMSFMVQARKAYHREIVDQQITTRVYDMENGRRITIADLFPSDSDAWDYIGNRVWDAVTTYFQDETPDPDKLAELCEPDSLAEMDFMLMGMSLVLYIPAASFYPEHHTLMKVVIMYSDIRDWMNEDAKDQTDNLSYYKTVALTFDDGPARINTTRVLNTLLKHGAVATFFVIGNRVSSFQDLVQREHDAGNSVASHNWHHGDVRKSSASALRAMPEKVNKVFQEAIGLDSPYDRVPYGLYVQMIDAKVGWSYIQWSIDTLDWEGKSVTTIVNTVRSEIKDGDIILCHDIKDNTADAAGMFIDVLVEHGYMFLTVDELFAKDGVQLEPDTVYYRCTEGDTSRK